MTDRTPKDRRDSTTRDVDRLEAHRGLATLGDRLVPLDAFHRASAAAGRRLTDDERRQAATRLLQRSSDGVPLEGPFRRIAVFGGVYSNHLALAALLEDAAARGVEAVYCLGDLGGFGPNPETVWPLLVDGDVRALQGNYEQSLASGREDCNCGYTDPRDNQFAELSYRYTAANCSAEFKRWMGDLPTRRRVRVGERELLLVHGSPRRVNDFLFASTTPTPFLEVLLDQERCDAVLCTHTGLHWHRALPSGRDLVNVGVIGRPANDGSTDVWYCVIDATDESVEGARLGVELVPLQYDHKALAEEMRRAELPEEFVDTIRTGWWTTCLEILPARERARSRF